jgi:DNA transposition AAA+ family ATPase
MHPAVSRRVGRFIATKEHRRFIEFADAVREYRYIGLCFGAAGVGKTLSARCYAHWQCVEPLLLDWNPRKKSDAAGRGYAALAQSRAVFYTPSISTTPRTLCAGIESLLQQANICIDLHRSYHKKQKKSDYLRDHTELVVIDEVERLSTLALESLRDLFDRSDFGLLLIGMPGMEKRMARYPQLYSRVGFAHHYRPLQGNELSVVLTRHWRKLGRKLDGADFADAQAIASIARITGGNFRLLHRLFAQIERVLQINGLTAITDEVVNTARSTLVFGAN